MIILGYGKYNSEKLNRMAIHNVSAFSFCGLSVFTISPVACVLAFCYRLLSFLSSLCRFTAITQFAHHGMIFVPLGYTFGNGMFEMNQVKGGSSYGAGTYAADGTRQPTDLELQQAFYQGKYMAEITKKLKKSPPPSDS